MATFVKFCVAFDVKEAVMCIGITSEVQCMMCDRNRIVMGSIFPCMLLHKNHNVNWAIVIFSIIALCDVC